MLKIYNAYNDRGMIRVDDYIGFSRGVFDTGYDGFQVRTGDASVKRANYELQKLKDFREYVDTVKVEEGYPLDFMICNPTNYKLLEKKCKDVPNSFEFYEQYGLNEEGILLFTYYIHLGYSDDELVQRIFGKQSDIGMYLIKPNASFSMTARAYPYDESLDYEVLQSKNLGKRLALVKMNRRIYNG